MSNLLHESQEINIDSLMPFQLHPVEIKPMEQLQELMDTIEHEGLKTPITVRRVDDVKYEIILGQNRVEAMKALGRDTIPAIIMDEMSDGAARELFYRTYLTPQAFWDWNYLQRFRAIQYIETLLKKNSHQGKRSDLIEKINNVTRDNQKHPARRSTSRDRAAASIGISSATLSRYRSMVKLDDESVILMARLLDEKRLTFAEAYQVSLLDPRQASILLTCLEEDPEKRIDIDKVKKHCTKEAKADTAKHMFIDRRIIWKMLKPR